MKQQLKKQKKEKSRIKSSIFYPAKTFIHEQKMRLRAMTDVCLKECQLLCGLWLQWMLDKNLSCFKKAVLTSIFHIAFLILIQRCVSPCIPRKWFQAFLTQNTRPVTVIRTRSICHSCLNLLGLLSSRPFFIQLHLIKHPQFQLVTAPQL